MLRICAAFVLLCLPLSALAGPVGPVRVIDADTWDVGGERVRLFGIDAPEMGQMCQDPQGASWACGVWATGQTRERYEHRTARCEAITQDRYDRIVARCHVGDADVARDLVADGLAFAYRKYSMDYDPDEKRAAANARGLHSGKVQSPAAFRAARLAAPSGDAQPSPGCAIKGNLSSTGARIYHVPGQNHYRRTRISVTKGERWFCTEKAARIVGWRRALR